MINTLNTWPKCPAGIRFIKQWEKSCFTSYQDGWGVWTIGCGHILGITAGQTIYQEQADAFLMDDLRPVESMINTHVGLTINQNHEVDVKSHQAVTK